MRNRNCDTLNTPETPPGTPMRPQCILVYLGDTNQSHWSKEIFIKNFEEQYDVPLYGLQSVNISNQNFTITYLLSIPLDKILQKRTAVQVPITCSKQIVLTTKCYKTWKVNSSKRLNGEFCLMTKNKNKRTYFWFKLIAITVIEDWRNHVYLVNFVIMKIIKSTILHDLFFLEAFWGFL